MACLFDDERYSTKNNIPATTFSPMDAFEGPEKKVELVVSGPDLPLREQPRPFWEHVVTQAKAAILSEIRGEKLDAYLLSESSLFVADDRVTLLTCGRTRLVDATRAIIQELGAGNVSLLIYERKNEHLPHRQETSFFDDAKELHSLIPGRAVQFGAEHSHCIRLFHSSKTYKPLSDDSTLEVLMHGIDRNVADQFTGGNDPTQDLELDKLGEGFEIDSHAFSPSGYSMNAVKDDLYYTFHVTPQPFGSYVSLETNLTKTTKTEDLIHRAIGVFAPQSFDVLSFRPGSSCPALDVPNYRNVQRTSETILGFAVDFFHYWKNDVPLQRPVVIDLGGSK